MRERRKYPRRVTPNYRQSGQAEYGDPADHGFPSQEEAPWHGFRAVHTVTLHRREDVGKLFAFGDGEMMLRTDHTRKAILVENAITGERLFIPRQNILMFFWSVLERFGITQTWNRSEDQDAGSVALALESPRARGAHHDTDEEFRQRGGKPTHRSAFKGTYGLIRNMRTNRLEAVRPRRNKGA